MAEHPPPPIFTSRYSTLPETLYREASLQPVSAPEALLLNDALADQLGLSYQWLHSSEALAALAGNAALPHVPRLAMAYAGHQFGHFVPSLGDGRAALLGELQLANGTGVDLHLKGSGRTVFSRGGDGRSTLSAMLREYIISEAMAGLGIPTTRALAVVKTGDLVARDRLEPGAVLTRVAKSHVRVGTFQFAAVRGDHAALTALVDLELARNFPAVPSGTERPIWFLRQAIARQAQLIARWMSVGFIHGVMNTDNMSVVGETIDYGPCAFMDGFDPQKTFSSIDQNGRYAWDKQPVVALWNLTRLAEALLPLINAQQEAAIALAEAELKLFMPQFEAAFEVLFLAKLGITQARPDDAEFIALTLRNMAHGLADFTLFFSSLADAFEAGCADGLVSSFSSSAAAEAWFVQWIARLEAEQACVALMRRSNPRYIARNHRVAEALASAEAGDMQPLQDLLRVVAAPFEQHVELEHLMAAPALHEEVLQTFCGT
ncbi:MAG: YdiU family protein [Alphaproteobacteria bacterium]|nr:YdiU family protein [Alphaproteobacteria bacterium]